MKQFCVVFVLALMFAVIGLPADVQAQAGDTQPTYLPIIQVHATTNTVHSANAWSTPSQECQPPPQKVVIGEDPFDQITTVVMEDGQITDCFVDPVPDDARGTGDMGQKDEPPVVEPNQSKIHPDLATMISTQPRDEMVQVLVSFQDPIQMPRFPEPIADEPLDSDANQEAVALAAQMIADIESQRAPFYAKMRDVLSDKYNAKLVDTFWLINGVLVEMPLGEVNRLAELPDVVYVSPRFPTAPPPQNSKSTDDVEDGRAAINSDYYYNMGLSGSYDCLPISFFNICVRNWLALLDTGVRSTHMLLNSSPMTHRDCTNGFCLPVAAPQDPCDHGTASAAILTGNANAGTAFRGVTGFRLDSFNVYFPEFIEDGSECDLDQFAVIKAFQRTIEERITIIVAEIQDDGTHYGNVAQAANNAFDTGSVIVAANGNFGWDPETLQPIPGSVKSPANARKVLGVGATNFDGTITPLYQSLGPTTDGRTKPDIQAPSHTETASSASDTAFKVYMGTSGATPYAGGAAALGRAWLKGTNFHIDPGQVYAMMILSGQRTFLETLATNETNTTGAGLIVMPGDGLYKWGKVTIGDEEIVRIPVDLFRGWSAGYTTVDAALWWPEGTMQKHNDVDLYLLEPSGAIGPTSFSTSVGSVFERVRIEGTPRLQEGRWMLEIRGFNIATSTYYPQTVYWMVHAKQ